jgi:hypothetical protein
MGRITHSLALVVLTLNVAVFAVNGSAKEPKVPKLLEFDSMIGLPSSMTGTQSPIRGINGGGLPGR